MPFKILTKSTICNLDMSGFRIATVFPVFESVFLFLFQDEEEEEEKEEQRYEGSGMDRDLVTFSEKIHQQNLNSGYSNAVGI